MNYPIATPPIVYSDLTNSNTTIDKIISSTYTSGNNTNWKNPVILNTVDNVELSGNLNNTYDILSPNVSTYGYGFYTSIYENTIVVGEIGTGGSVKGKIWIYEKVGNTLVLQDILTNDNIKTVATLFTFGNHIAVEDYILEKIWVYKKTGGVWSLQQEIMSDVATFSISMSEGLLAIGGSPHINGEYTNVGVYIYREVGETWILEHTIAPTSIVLSIRLSLFEETLVFGSLYDPGIVIDSYIYERINGVWTEQQHIQDYGLYTTINGTTAAMSSFTDTVIYNKNNGTWTQNQIINNRNKVSIYEDVLVISEAQGTRISFYERINGSNPFILKKQFVPSDIGGFLPGISIQIYSSTTVCSYEIGQFDISFPDTITSLFTLGESSLVFYEYQFESPTRILVCNQTNEIENGIYYTSNSDWERTDDMPANSQAAGIMVYSKKFNAMYYSNQMGIVGIDIVNFNKITFIEGSSIEGSVQYFKNNSIIGSRYFLTNGDDIFLGGKNTVSNITAPILTTNKLGPGASEKTTGDYITGYYVPRSGSINYYGNFLFINSTNMTTGNTTGTANVSDYNSSFVFNEAVIPSGGGNVILEDGVNTITISSTVITLPKSSIVVNSGYSVVLNTKQGTITIANSDIIPSYGTVTYVLTNNLLTASSVVIYSIGNGTSPTGIPSVSFSVSSGSADIVISNVHPTDTYDTSNTKILFVVF
jgi:hypothetical protein